MKIEEMVTKLHECRLWVEDISDEVYQNGVFVDSQVEAVDNLRIAIARCIRELSD